MNSIITYTAWEKAAEVVGNNRNDSKLQRRLTNYLQGDLSQLGPFAPKDGQPPAVLAEYLAWTARSTADYTSLARQLGFAANIVTYVRDAAETVNDKKGAMVSPKVALADPGCLLFRPKPTRKDQPFGQTEIGNLKTRFGVKLADFWLALRQANRDPDMTGVGMWDISEWYIRQAKNLGWTEESEQKASLSLGWTEGEQTKASFYYPRLMGLYTMAAVFVDYSEYPKFGYAEPAFAEAKQQLGVDPVIVKWSPKYSYPAKGNPDRTVGPYTVDLTDTDLTLKSFDGWVLKQIEDWKQI